MCVTTPSTWPWIAHLVSGLRLATVSLYSNSLSLRLPYSVKLATKRKSLTHYAKGTQSLSVELHSTGSLSVDHEYLALEDGPPIFRQDVTCPALLRAFLVPLRRLRVRGYHPLWPHFPERSTVFKVIKS